MTGRSRLARSAKYLIVVIFAVVSLFPIVIMVMTSLKTRAQVFSMPPIWFYKPKLSNYSSVLLRQNFLRYFGNSIIIGLTSTFLSVSVGAFAAYALARFKFMGKKVVMAGTLFFRMIPPVILVIPIFILWGIFGLADTRTGVIIAYTALNLPLNIWILKTFISEIPVEIEESAFIDGCSEIIIFSRIIVPLVAPGISVASIFTFRIAWNEFILSLVLTNRYSRTLPVAVSLYLTDTGIQWGQITAIATIIALPAFIFTFVAAKNLIMGLTAGAIKG